MSGPQTMPGDVMEAARRVVETLASGADPVETVALAILSERGRGDPILETRPWVDVENLNRMISALNTFKGHEWWLRNPDGKVGGRTLSPVVMLNLLAGIEEGTVEPSILKLRNALSTAMRYRDLWKLSQPPHDHDE